MSEIYGSDERCHPVTLPALSMTLDGRRLDNEAGVRAAGSRMALPHVGSLVVVLGWFLMKFGIRTEETDWSRYQATLARNSDVRKFNDVYRQVLAGNAAQREALTAWLEERYARRELAYGLHVTDRAHMTCLVFDYSGRHLHFIDGADGGFFAAASAFKERAAKPRMIAIDWGTSSFRAYRLDAHGTFSNPGLRARASSTSRRGNFPASSRRRSAAGSEAPIVMSGMVGSRQGWVEAPYVQCPAGFDEIAAKLPRRLGRRGGLDRARRSRAATRPACPT